MIALATLVSIDESKIGGSDIYTILGLSSRTPAHLAMRLRGDPIPDDNLYGVMGHSAEPALIDWYRNRMRVNVLEPKRFENDWARATPDAEVQDPLTGEVWGLEVKFWDPTRRREFGSPMSDEVAIQVMVQCQWYMHFLGWPRMDVAISFGNREPELYHLDSLPDMQARLVHLGRAFFCMAHKHGPIAAHGRLEAPTKPRSEAAHPSALPSIDTMNKVRYLAKAARIEAAAGKRKKLAQAWALQHVGHQPGRIVTPDATVSVYRTSHGSLAVRATSRKAKL